MFTKILNIFQRIPYFISRILFVGLDPERDGQLVTTTRILVTASSSGSVTNLVANSGTERLLKCPVVIVHGFIDRPSVTGIEHVTQSLLSQLGIEHYTPEMQGLGSIFERSQSLVEQIASKYPGKTVHLISHSMGGLNARDIATSSMTTDLGFKIKTVTTLGTPHRGIKAIHLVPNLNDTSEFATALRDLIGTDLGALGDMTDTAMLRYNETHQTNPDVQYFTWAGLLDLKLNLPNPLIALTYAFTRPFGPTDGIINVESATWGPDLGGQGTHLGTVDGADHFSLLGPTAILGTIAHLRAAEDGAVAVVQRENNTMANSIFRRLSGTINSLILT